MVHFIPPCQRRLVMLAAQADTAPALISGADGTGKGAIARWIHRNGPRVSHPFVTATQREPLAPQIRAAQGGTLLMPEIGEWPRADQQRLLGLLKTHSIEVGGVPMILNVRVIATTSQSLDGRAQGGLFNGELLEKLNVFRIEMPPLASRTEEFADIVQGIVAELAHEVHKDYLNDLSAAAWERLEAYTWPGNLRELRNVLRVAVVAAAGDRIESTDLPGFGVGQVDFRATREAFERTYILGLLRTFDWQIDRTCEMARLDREVLLGKMRTLGISDQKPAEGGASGGSSGQAG